MITHLIEATNIEAGGMNHGKFLVAKFDREWIARSEVDAAYDAAMVMSLIRRCGWAPDHILVLDLETGEGAMFWPHGIARIDLNTKRRIWVCPMFEPFLTWLYSQDLTDITKLPKVVQIDTPESALHGYRRSGSPYGNWSA